MLLILAMNLMNVLMTIYLIFIKVIVQIVLILANSKNWLAISKLKITEVDVKLQNLR